MGSRGHNGGGRGGGRGQGQSQSRQRTIVPPTASNAQHNFFVELAGVFPPFLTFLICGICGFVGKSQLMGCPVGGCRRLSQQGKNHLCMNGINLQCYKVDYPYEPSGIVFMKNIGGGTYQGPSAFVVDPKRIANGRMDEYKEALRKRVNAVDYEVRTFYGRILNSPQHLWTMHPPCDFPFINYPVSTCRSSADTSMALTPTFPCPTAATSTRLGPGAHNKGLPAAGECNIPGQPIWSRRRRCEQVRARIPQTSLPISRHADFLFGSFCIS